VSGASFYDRTPGRYAIQKQEFQRLVAELKRLASKKGYSQAQIASEVGVSPITVNNWLTRRSLMAQRVYRAIAVPPLASFQPAADI
jgi:lambda repressor-like predicted transcriptional regulator